jgi:hypothetical protein
MEDGNLGKFVDDSKEDIPPTAAAAFSSARRTASSSAAARAASSASLVALDFHQPAHDAEDAVVVGKIVVDVDDVEVVASEMAEQTTNDTTEEPPLAPPPPLALLPIHDDDVVDCMVQTDRVAAATAACRDSGRPSISGTDAPHLLGTAPSSSPQNESFFETCMHEGFSFFLTVDRQDLTGQPNVKLSQPRITHL